MTQLSALVIGSGPAGVSAAWPLAQAGLPIAIVAGARPSLEPPPLDRPSLADLRHGASRSGLLGADLRALRILPGLSPKLRSAAPADFQAGYADANRQTASSWTLVGTLAAGGLSNVWGAAAAFYDAGDLAGWPIGLDALTDSYRTVAARVGLSGVIDDDLGAFHGNAIPLQPPLPLSPCAESVLTRYGRSHRQAHFRLGRTRNAVLTLPLGQREPCRLDQACMLGCPTRSIYSAAFDLDQLESLPNVTVIRDMIVSDVARGENSVTVIGHTLSGEERRLEAGHAVLAAGTPATSRLVLSRLGWVDRPIRLLNTPAFAFAALVPRMLGKGLPTTGFGMGQLAFRLELDPNTRRYAYGLVYDASSFALSDFGAGLPLTTAGYRQALGAFLSGLMVALVYLPGDRSQSTTTLRRSTDGDALEICGETPAETVAEARRAHKILASELRRLGVWGIPGSLRMLEPGAEVHYAGTLPMCTVTAPDGTLCSDDRIVVADASTFTTLAAKHHTLTMMANADRVGRLLASRLA